MKQRDTVRLLLLDGEGRILLMRIHHPDIAAEDGGPSLPCWITIGGGVEPGETILEVAAREGREETGISGLHIGDVVGYIERPLVVRGEPVLFKESYVQAHAPDTALDAAGWTDEERRVVKGLRWWTLDELRATEEVVFPEGLAEMLQNYLSSS